MVRRTRSLWPVIVAALLATAATTVLASLESQWASTRIGSRSAQAPSPILPRVAPPPIARTARATFAAGLFGVPARAGGACRSQFTLATELGRLCYRSCRTDQDCPADASCLTGPGHPATALCVVK